MSPRKFKPGWSHYKFPASADVLVPCQDAVILLRRAGQQVTAVVDWGQTQNCGGAAPNRLNCTPHLFRIDFHAAL